VGIMTCDRCGADTISTIMSAEWSGFWIRAQ
jgi:hypothetical protein